jgi:tetratricopeptide (TPR) repeat protein
MDRVAAFKAFIERSPDDPFPRYGLAMEYCNQGRKDDARQAFEQLMERFPDYVPAYLMAGGNLAELGDGATAAAVYRRGIEAATRAGDAHARGELEAALAQLPPSE